MSDETMDRRVKRRDHLLGILLILGSAITFSFSGVLTKMISSGAWTIACWRGLVGAILITLYVVWRDERRSFGIVLDLGWKGWFLATVGSLASFAFILSFKLTYVANVAIVYATVPFVAALLEWIALRQLIRGQTLAAACLSFLGVAIMVSGGVGLGHFTGDMVSVLMTIGMALYMVLIRVFSDTSVVLAGAASAFQLFVVGWFIVDPLDVSARDAILLLLFGAVFAFAVILWTEGTRKMPAAEAGLLGSAETPLAAFFAWIILAELPPQLSLIGGALVLIAVFWHAGRDFVRSSAKDASTT